MYNKKTIVLYDLCFGIWSECTILCVYSLVLLYQVRKHYNIIMYHNRFVNYWTRTRVSVLGKCTVPENCTTVPYCTRKLYHLYRTVPYPEPYHSKEIYGHMVFLVPIHSMRTTLEKPESWFVEMSAYQADNPDKEVLEKDKTWQQIDGEWVQGVIWP